MRLLRLLLGIAVLCFSPTAHANDPPLPFSVHSVGKSECAPATFAVKLEQRSPRLRPASPGNRPALDFELDVERRTGKLAARLRVRELDGAETTREVEGVSCDEVLSALALIAVVLVDPSALEKNTTFDVASPRITEPREAGARRRRPWCLWRVGAGVNGGVESAVSPDVTVVAALQLEALLGGDGTFSPRAAVALERSAGNTLSTPGGNAHFVWTAARVTGCPLRFPSSGQLAVRPCLFMDVGVLDVTGEQTFRASSTRVSWFSLGALAHAELWPVKRLALGLDAGVVTPFVRDRFFFDPGDAASTLTVPRLGLTLRSGLTLYFE